MREMRQQRLQYLKPRAADSCRQTDHSRVYRIGEK
jgi:hypothetical protein